MYQYLAGELVEKTPTSVVLDVQGVGYHIHIPLSTFANLAPTGQTVRLFTHFVVREDAHALYGFSSSREREFFRLLLGISGIGPKLAITILSGVPLEELKQAIAQGTLPVLTAIPGIGRKMAERIVVELREKLVVEDRPLAAASGAGVAAVQTKSFEDAAQALVELGYRKQNAKQALQKVLQEDAGKARLSVPDLIRASLKYV